jgi:hypothetical protein
MSNSYCSAESFFGSRLKLLLPRLIVVLGDNVPPVLHPLAKLVAAEIFPTVPAMIDGHPTVLHNIKHPRGDSNATYNQDRKNQDARSLKLAWELAKRT